MQYWNLIIEFFYILQLFEFCFHAAKNILDQSPTFILNFYIAAKLYTLICIHTIVLFINIFYWFTRFLKLQAILFWY